MRLLNWLNSNQGAVLSLLTLVYVATTVGMMRAMSRANALSSLSLKQAIEIERARTRPFVVFYLDFQQPAGTVTATLSNIGATAAFDITVSLKPALVCIWGQAPRETALAARKLAFLPPGHRERDLLATITEFHQHYIDPAFSGEVSYTDADGRRYREPIAFDFNYRKEIGWSYPKDPADQLAKLHEDLRNLTGAVKEIATRITISSARDS